MATKTKQPTIFRRAYIFAVIGLATFLLGLGFWRRPPIVYDVAAEVAYQHGGPRQGTDYAVTLSNFEKKICSVPRLVEASEQLGLSHPDFCKSLAKAISVKAVANEDTPAATFQVEAHTSDPELASAIIQQSLKSLIDDFDSQKVSNELVDVDPETAKVRVQLAKARLEDAQQALEQFLWERSQVPPSPTNEADQIDIYNAQVEMDSHEEFTPDGPPIQRNSKTLPISLENGATDETLTGDDEVPEAPSNNFGLSEDTQADASAETAENVADENTAGDNVADQNTADGDKTPDVVADPESEPSPSDIITSDTNGASAGANGNSDSNLADQNSAGVEPVDQDSVVPVDEADTYHAQDDPTDEDFSILDPDPAQDQVQRQPEVPSTPSQDQQPTTPPLIIDPSPYYKYDDDCDDDGRYYGADLEQKDLKFVSYEQFLAATSMPPEFDAGTVGSFSSMSKDPALLDSDEYAVLREASIRAQQELDAAVSAEQELLSNALDGSSKVWIGEPASVKKQQSLSISPLRLIGLLGVGAIFGYLFSKGFNPAASDIICTASEAKRATQLPLIATLGLSRVASALGLKNRQRMIGYAVMLSEGVLAVVLVVMGYFAIAETSFAKRVAKNPFAAYTEAVGRVVDGVETKLTDEKKATAVN